MLHLRVLLALQGAWMRLGFSKMCQMGTFETGSFDFGQQCFQ